MENLEEALACCEKGGDVDVRCTHWRLGVPTCAERVARAYRELLESVRMSIENNGGPLDGFVQKDNLSAGIWTKDAYVMVRRDDFDRIIRSVAVVEKLEAK